MYNFRASLCGGLRTFVLEAYLVEIMCFHSRYFMGQNLYEADGTICYLHSGIDDSIWEHLGAYRGIRELETWWMRGTYGMLHS